MALAVDERVSAGDIAAVEHHGPVADDHPLVKSPPLVEEIVVFHALPAVPAGGVALRQPAVDEGVVLRIQHVGQRVDEVQLGPEMLRYRRAHGADVRLRREREAYLLAHLRQQARAPAHAVAGEIAPQVALRVVLRAVYLLLPAVAVALHGEHAALLRQIHDIAQRGKALRPLLHHVAAENERVLLRELELVQKRAQIWQVSVYVGYHGDAPVLRQLRALDFCRPHHIGRSIRYCSEETPASRRSFLKP